jgi:hypothetical protein
MPIKRPDIYEHNNPNDAFVDSDFVRGGIRTTANTINDLYTLSGKTDQLKVYATKIYVVDEDGYYILKDINNVDNINGWIREDVLILSNINNFSATTISATTYLGLPKDVFVTGGTYNAGTAVFTNNTGGTFNVVGFSTGGGTFTGGTVTGPTIFTGGLSANTFSASTYFGLPKDVFVTGGTYSNGTAVFRNNTGGTFNVVGLTTPFTGGTVSGNTIFTNGLTANTLSVSSFNGSTNRIVEVNSGGTLSATQEIISAYIVSGSTAANLLENTTNWDINGIYTGTTISNTFMGQKHYNFNYFFEAVDNNLWIRLIRG